MIQRLDRYKKQHIVVSQNISKYLVKHHGDTFRVQRITEIAANVTKKLPGTLSESAEIQKLLSCILWFCCLHGGDDGLPKKPVYLVVRDASLKRKLQLGLSPYSSSLVFTE